MGDAVERTSHFLARSDHYQRDQYEEDAEDDLEREAKFDLLQHAHLAAEEHDVRIRLIGDVHVALDLRTKLHNEQAGAERQGQKERRVLEQPCRPVGEQTADRHADECREQHGVREKGQIQDMCREPANARQFQKQNQAANQKEIEPWTGRGVVRHARSVVQKTRSGRRTLPQVLRVAGRRCGDGRCTWRGRGR